MKIQGKNSYHILIIIEWYYTNEEAEEEEEETKRDIQAEIKIGQVSSKPSIYR